ncbi:DUF6766 family protein [Deinococcus radiopugnans]|uniref:Transmembrane protein n=1 Tax=Deinococcus radiopugnans ATCC 19172 TaxID=585398 RepID=A0A5C4XZQ0_9DEIO|nr:DUF6766 family protein [Deinococcus radiopugnans]MBB6018315.1 hypothetical protein [Deinococcus radiopugnans ATCC 19172]TNM68066.1 hypothetical protein FHR04_17170 [Deinococcus radiopugnans ATCC 19172]
MKRFWADNALLLVLLGFFLLFWLAQALSGWAGHNQELGNLKQHTLNFAQYLASAHFWSATAENWESEFLQLAAYVVLTIHLKQRGSAESNPYEDEKDDTQRQQDQQERRAAAQARFWRRNSLTLALLGLFVLSLLMHLRNSWQDDNLERLARGQNAETLWAFLGQPEFWFESFQNWQSEFLAVAVIVVLTIFLRQVGSSQSKRLDEPHRKTGDD